RPNSQKADTTRACRDAPAHAAVARRAAPALPLHRRRRGQSASFALGCRRGIRNLPKPDRVDWAQAGRSTSVLSVGTTSLTGRFFVGTIARFAASRPVGNRMIVWALTKPSPRARAFHVLSDLQAAGSS